MRAFISILSREKKYHASNNVKTNQKNKYNGTIISFVCGMTASAKE